MNVKSWVRKLEAKFLLPDWSALRPADTSAEQWKRIGILLQSLDDQKFTPWKSHAAVIEWLEQIRPAALIDCPDPVLSAHVQLSTEAAGEPVPTWLWHLDQATDEELQGIIGECEAAMSITLDTNTVQHKQCAT